MLLLGFVATSVAVAFVLLGIAFWKWRSHRKLVRQARAVMELAEAHDTFRATRGEEEEETQPFTPERPSPLPQPGVPAGPAAVVAAPEQFSSTASAASEPAPVSAPPSLAPEVVRVSASLSPGSQTSLPPVAVESRSSRATYPSLQPARPMPEPRAPVEESGPSLRPGLKSTDEGSDRISRTTPAFEKSGPSSRRSRAPQGVSKVTVQEVVVRSRRDDR